LQGFRFRKTGMMKIVEESLAKLDCPESITVDVKSGLEDDAVWMDHDQMVTTMTDLEQNAVEAMPDGGKLTISVEGNERQITIGLADTGKGIPEENMPLLFTPFFTTKPVGEGTGLGLPQAYAIVKVHHGEISITSNADPGKGPTGTTVKIILPRRQAFQQQEARIILHEEED